MRVVLVSNPSSGSSTGEIVDEIAAILGSIGEVRRIEPSLESFDKTLRAAARDASLVVTAGGDGTMNQTVNALADRFDDLRFALVPMGTGNDLARTLDIPREPSDAAEAIVEGAEKSIDVSAASSADAESLFVILDGAIQFTVNGKDEVVKPGQAAIFGSSDRHSLRAADGVTAASFLEFHIPAGYTTVRG